VSEVVSQLQLQAELLPLPEDRLLTFVEGAQVRVGVGGAALAWLGVMEFVCACVHLSL
jgi:hypothetical protein